MAICRKTHFFSILICSNIPGKSKAFKGTLLKRKEAIAKVYFSIGELNI
jgi:hypothetical protein